MKYYVNYKNQFGKTFEASSHGVALAWATGYAYAKGWKRYVNLYCQTTGEYITRRWTGFSPHYLKYVTKYWYDWDLVAKYEHYTWNTPGGEYYIPIKEGAY